VVEPDEDEKLPRERPDDHEAAFLVDLQDRVLLPALDDDAVDRLVRTPISPSPSGDAARRAKWPLDTRSLFRIRGTKLAPLVYL
jgi:hypothetical protein